MRINQTQPTAKRLKPMKKAVLFFGDKRKVLSTWHRNNCFSADAGKKQKKTKQNNLQQRHPEKTAETKAPPSCKFCKMGVPNTKDIFC